MNLTLYKSVNNNSFIKPSYPSNAGPFISSVNHNTSALPGVGNLRITLAQWNCRSLSLDKLNYVTSYECDVILLQEVWHPKLSVLNQIPKKPLLQIRNDKQAGGSLLWFKKLNCQINRSLYINSDFSLHRVLVDRDKYIWIGSLYLAQGSIKQIQELFRKIYLFVPSFEWKFIILAGDFNINLHKGLSQNSMFISLLKQFGLTLQRSNRKTSLKGEPDFLIHGSAINAKLLSSNNSPSDHKLMIWDIELPCPDSKNPVRIPNRSFAEHITHYAWCCSSNSHEFLRNIQYSKVIHPDKILQTIKRKSFKKPTIQKLLDAQEDSDAFEIIRSYFRQFNADLEEQRFSNLSKKFFDYLRKVFKYDQISKRDGSIVSSLKDEHDQIITNEAEVHKQIMLTIKELQVDLTKPRPLNLEFPQLNTKSLSEMNEILASLSNSKAIAYDGITDSIFKKEYSGKSSIIFADLWASLKQIPNTHFESRMVPLNKLHPNIPSRKDIRPIIITSPIVKMIEAALLPELKDYLIKQLHPGQIGFVPGNGILVNIYRVIERIRKRTLLGKRCYGVFIDFSSAYNTIDHGILFKLLQPIIGQKNTDLIRALYSRMKIRLGKETITPNQGVAQGSLISPALFDIYAQNLLLKLQSEVHIDIEDLLAYADDTLIICESLEEVSRVLKQIRTWSQEYNMKLNEKKSGIVEFTSRQMRPKLNQNSYEGFPICQEYKYLGLILSSKLYMTPQLNFIWRKTNEIYQKLSPFLFSSDLDSRKSMWQIFIQPLIEFILPLYKWEKAKNNVNKADSIIRKSFKLFTGLKVNTSNEVVDLLSGYNFRQRANLIYEISSQKWDCRKKGILHKFEFLPISIRHSLNASKINVCKRMPHELIEYLNCSKSLCATCGVPNSINHLKYVHNCPLPNLTEILKLTKIIRLLRVPGSKVWKRFDQLLKVFSHKCKSAFNVRRISL